MSRNRETAAAERAIVEREVTELLVAAEQYTAHGRATEATTAHRLATALRGLVDEPR